MYPLIIAPLYISFNILSASLKPVKAPILASSAFFQILGDACQPKCSVAQKALAVEIIAT